MIYKMKRNWFCKAHLLGNLNYSRANMYTMKQREEGRRAQNAVLHTLVGRIALMLCST